MKIQRSRIWTIFWSGFSTCRCTRDIQKTLSWAPAGLTSSQGLINMHIVESLGNSFALLYSHLHQFIMRTAVFDSHDDHTDVTALWLKKGLKLMPGPPLHLRAHDCSNGQLDVNSQARCVESTRQYLVSHSLFPWRKCVDTRFCGTGVSMRAVLASLCCGLAATFMCAIQLE